LTEGLGKWRDGGVSRIEARFTTQQMLAREEFRKRLEKKTPIPSKDLLYPLLQAYDSVAIEADVEVGGTDQLFNILAGRELQEQIGQPPQSVFITQMLEGLDGQVMSKSKPTTGIWLTDPPHEVYGKVMSIEDKLMAHYFEWGTELPLKEVRATLDAIGRKELHPREAKRLLARTITADLHSVAAAEEAEREFDRVHKDHEAPEDIEVREGAVDGQLARRLVDRFAGSPDVELRPVFLVAMGETKAEAGYLIFGSTPDAALAASYGRSLGTTHALTGLYHDEEPGRALTLTLV